LRLGRCDARLLRQLLPILRKHGPKSSHTTKRELLAIINRAIDLYFHIGEEHDILFSSGVLVFELGDYERAIDLFMKSIELYGIDAGSAYNLALAHYRRSRPGDALEWAKEALKAEPAHVAARKLKEELELSLAQG
jgi:tetratricopeptide (TPR) repeat protein